jgi:hypothetical protein
LLEGGEVWMENLGGFMFIDDLFYSLSVQMLAYLIDYMAMESLV